MIYQLFNKQKHTHTHFFVSMNENKPKTHLKNLSI